MSEQTVWLWSLSFVLFSPHLLNTIVIICTACGRLFVNYLVWHWYEKSEWSCFTINLKILFWKIKTTALTYEHPSYSDGHYAILTGCHTLLKQMSTAGSFNLTVALPSSTNHVKNFSMLSFSCNTTLAHVSCGKIHCIILQGTLSFN